MAETKKLLKYCKKFTKINTKATKSKKRVHKKVLNEKMLYFQLKRKNLTKVAELV